MSKTMAVGASVESGEETIVKRKLRRLQRPLQRIRVKDTYGEAGSPVGYKQR